MNPHNPINPGEPAAPIADPNAGALTAAVVPVVATTLQGTVVQTNPALGELVLTNADGNYVVSGAPQQIAQLAMGTNVNLPFENISGYFWLPPPPRRQQQPPTTQRLIGTVRQVDQAQGLLVVDRIRLRARPELLQNFVPDQTVAIAVETIDNVTWLRAIQPSAG